MILKYTSREIIHKFSPIHVAYYDSSTDEWRSAETDELMYKEYIIGWMDIPE